MQGQVLASFLLISSKYQRWTYLKKIPGANAQNTCDVKLKIMAEKNKSANLKGQKYLRDFGCCWTPGTESV